MKISESPSAAPASTVCGDNTSSVPAPPVLLLPNGELTMLPLPVHQPYAKLILWQHVTPFFLAIHLEMGLL